MGGFGSGRKPDPIKLITGIGNSNTQIASVGDQPLNLPNYSGIKKFIDTHDVIDPVDLTPYARLDGTNQPFIANVELSATTPTLSLTNSETESANLVKQETDSEFYLSNEVVPYVPENALNLNGSGWADRGSNVTTGTSYTIEFWFKSNAVDGDMVLTGGNGYHLFWFFTNTSVRSYIGTTSFSSWTITNVNDNLWHHWALVRSGRDLTLYRDGVSLGTVTASGTQNFSSIYRYLGSSSGAAQFVNGSVDQFVVWNYALNSTEVSARYNSGDGAAVSDYTNVIACYRFNDNYTDSSGNGYNLSAAGSGNSFVAGKVQADTPPLTEYKLIRHYESTTPASAGYLKFGISGGIENTATENVFDGKNYTFNVDGADYLVIDDAGDLFLRNDSQTLTFGAGDDYSISFTGTGALHSITSGYFNFDKSVKINGTGTPSQQLEVVGTIFANGGDLATTSDLYADDWRNNTTGTLVATSTNASGDVSFNNNVTIGNDLFIADTNKEYFGTGNDTSIYFDGSDMIINSENVTANDELVIQNFDYLRVKNPIIPEQRTYFPMGELSYFDTTGTTITISGTSDGSSNMVVCNPTTTLSSSYEFDNGGSNNGRLRYTGTATKMFHTATTISIASTGANDTFVFGVAKNGTVIASSKIIMKVGGASDTISTAMHQMVELATNDYLELYVGNLTDSDDCVVKTLNIFAMGV